MVYSKKTIGDIADVMIYTDGGWRTHGNTLTHPAEYYANWCEHNLGWENLVVDFNGTRTPGDMLGRTNYASIDRDTLCSVKEFFEVLYMQRRFSRAALTTSRHWSSSYHLKHVIEKLRKKTGDGMGADENGWQRDGYVSNGEFIIGYVMFLADFLLYDEKTIRKIIRNEPGPNVWCRLPATFSALEAWLHERRAI